MSISDTVTILHLESNTQDHETVAHLLASSDIPCTISHVATPEALQEALDSQQSTLILSDWHPENPAYQHILSYALKHFPDLPFVVISHPASPEEPLETIRLGAHDYILKQHLTVLPSVIERELRDARSRQERRHARNALATSEKRLSTIIASAMDAIITADQNLNVILFNEAAEEMFQFPSKEMIGQSLTQLFPAAWHDQLRSFLTICQLSAPDRSGIRHKRFHVPLRGLRKNQMEFPVEASLAYSEADEAALFTLVLRDITDRTLAEEKHRSRLNRSQVHQRALLSLAQNPATTFEAALHHITETDLDSLDVDTVSIYRLMEGTGEMLLVDRFNRKTRTHSSAEMLSLHNFPAYSRALRENKIIDVTDAFQDIRTRDFALTHFADKPTLSLLDVAIRLNGKWIGVVSHESHTARVWTPEEINFAAMMASMISLEVETSQLREAQAALRESQKFLEESQAVGHVGSWTIDLDEPVPRIHCSRETYHIFGIPPHEFRGNLDQFYQLVHPVDRPRIINAISKTIEKSAPLDVSHRLVHPNGDIRWIHAQLRVNPDSPHRALGLIQDITDQKNAEEEKLSLERQLRQAQKMEAIGTLAGGIAHDFNNILTAIIGFASLARDNPKRSPCTDSDLDHILSASNRAKDLVHQILTFSRRNDSIRSAVHLDSLVGEMIKLLQATVPANILLVEKIVPKIPPIMADPSQIHQVLMNLATNACQAMQDNGGTLTLSLSQEIIEPHSPIQQLHNLIPGTYLRVDIQDTGDGIPTENLDRIFDPFFTTKPQGKGTGLGLSVVLGIIREHHGTVLVESELQKGSTFSVLLPIAQSEVSLPPPFTPTTLPTGNGERILFVDDESILVTLGQKSLERLGYHSVCHTDSTEALRDFMQNPHRFDAVVTDRMMPNLSGIEFARKLLAIRPDLPIIMLTGYTDTQSSEEIRLAGVRELLLKPIEWKDLAHILYNILHSPNPPVTPT